ncbi:MAG: hypothetical protein WCC26_02290 [Terracidiphilus sp.]
MNLLGMSWVGLRVAVGVCSAFVTLHGLYGVYGLDFRRDTLVSVLYCLLPFLSFFVFLFIKAPKLETSLFALIAGGYLAAYSMLDWRTCDALGYCTSVTATVFKTLCTKAVLASFGAILFSGAALLLGDPKSKPSA